MAQEKTITVDDVSRGLDKGLNTADQERAATIERLQSVRSAKATSLQREQTRLTLKYGADHPRVQALAGRAALNQGLVSNLAAETARAKIEIPTADENTWVFHGYVRDQSGRGLPELTVAPYDKSDRSGNWVKDLGYVCTNDQGYFTLAVANLKDGTAATAFPRVLNSQGATLYCGSQPLTVQAGQVDYREIIISGDPVDCAPPPPPPPTTAEWIVRGQVIDATGAVLPGVTVSLADKDQVFAARLGKTQTDPAGKFNLAYRASDFTDLIAKKPDLFLQVSGGGLKQPYTHPTALHFEPGRTENLIVTIKDQSPEIKPWIVRGQVTDSAGSALPGLTVTIADRERKLADRLGKTQTGAKGEFEFTYKAEAFADLIEQPVDLLLQVLDPNQKPLYTHGQALHFEPGKAENIPIVIKRA
jgi:protocatechuate 3,4-dioxygenase beta subunit